MGDERTMGEVDLIAALRAALAVPAAGVRVGIGDDAALLELTGPTLLTCDTMVEGVHFDLGLMTLADAAYRCLSANLSDVAAMGGRPGAFVLSVAAPARGPRASEVAALGEGLRAALTDHGASGAVLVGGDTVRASGGWALTITLLGRLEAPGPALRSGAAPGDRLCVTRPLGDAAGGFEALRRGWGEAFPTLARAHRRPLADVALGPALAEAGLVTAMIDLSDGLGVDLGRLLEASGCGGRVDLERLPVSEPLAALAQRLGCDPIDWAVGGGEDYTVCVAIAPARLEAARGVVGAHGAHLTEVGVVTADTGLRWTHHGQPVTPERLGFTHFAADAGGAGGGADAAPMTEDPS